MFARYLYLFYLGLGLLKTSETALTSGLPKNFRSAKRVSQQNANFQYLFLSWVAQQTSHSKCLFMSNFFQVKVHSFFYNLFGIVILNVQKHLFHLLLLDI
jgi:hypothetical protein